MRPIIILLGWLFAGSVLGFGLLHVMEREYPKTSLVDTVVLVKVGEGHGSGVYIGNGRVITAAHVAKDAPNGHAIVVFRGNEYDAPVVWFDEVTDTALLSIQSKIVGMATAKLACEMPDVRVGDAVTAIGNPLWLNNIRTWGRVSGSANYNNGNEDKPSVTAIVADLTVVPGNSGGPAFSHGMLVGITNALLSQQMMMSVVLFPETFIIPRSVICQQLAAKHPTPKFDPPEFDN